MNTPQHFKPLLCAGIFVLSLSVAINAYAASSGGTQLAKPKSQGRGQAAALGTSSKNKKAGMLLEQESVVNAAGFGDSYSLAPWIVDDLDQFYLASTNGAPTTHTFDGVVESGGGNNYGSAGGSFSVIEGIIDLGGGAERYVVEVSAVDVSLNNEPWVDASWAGQVFTDWILDVGNIDGGGNAIVPGYEFSVTDSGFLVFDSSGSQLGGFDLYSDTSTSTELAGGAWVNINGSDIAGFDVSTIQLYWDIIPTAKPEFSSTPLPGTTLSFGSIVINTTSGPAVVSVDNLGTAELTLSCDITGLNADQFNIVACPGSIAAAGSADITVSCEPGSTGLKQGTFEVSTNDADEALVSYPLACTGISGELVFRDGFEEAPTLMSDLVVVNPGVSNASLTLNQAYTINATARNQGEGDSDASTLRYYLSSDNVISVDDSLLGTDAIPGLMSGADFVQNLDANAPGGEGIFWVGACIDAVAGEANTSNQCSDAIQIDVVSPVDSDNDRIPDAFETNTGIFVDSSNTGTDPENPDTDGDGIKDGDEVLGTLAGLDLPGMGTNPLRKDLLLEYDWFDDSIDCGAHTHRPSAATIAMVTAAFSNSPVTNPGGTDGVNLISDYGQGGLFSGGNLINDADGVIAGGVGGSDFASYKAANFAANRNGYFRYVLLPHFYNTNSLSSGQAEVLGDDLIVSLYCANTDGNVANTIMHEVGHNLNLRHGGNENCNYKPNYNSVMNYKYQFPGVDSNCTPPADGVLDFSAGDRISLDESNLNEFDGTCGPGNPWDWNGNAILENPVIANINAYDSEVGQCGATLTILNDHDDWGNLVFEGVSDADGAPVVPVEIITEQPVPAGFLNHID
jgi:hypothetical protein